MVEGSVGIASATALFYLEQGVYLYPEGRFPDNKRVWSKKFSGGLAPSPCLSAFLHIGWYSSASHDMGL